MQTAETIVLVYGSLMSGLGLRVLGPLRVRSAGRVAFTNARRGFGRLSHRGGHYAMCLEALVGHTSIGARLLAAGAPPAGEVEGLALEVAPVALARIADRAGYSSGALQRLREDATTERLSVAEHLRKVFEDAGCDVRNFRARLYRRIGYTSPHGIPHPVRLTDGRCALTFLNPGIEGTGSDRIAAPPPPPALFTLAEVCRRQAGQGQLEYAVACLLGGVHGIAVHDLLASLAQDPVAAGTVRRAIPAEQRQELARFLAATGLPASTYFTAFGPASHALSRGGLNSLLRGCMTAADT